MGISGYFKCICGYEGNGFVVLKAVLWRESIGSFSDVYFPDQGANLLVCPECGTVRCNVRVLEKTEEKSEDQKYVRIKNFSDHNRGLGWIRNHDTMF
jgi:hypothetical protein